MKTEFIIYIIKILRSFLPTGIRLYNAAVSLAFGTFAHLHADAHQESIVLLLVSRHF